MEETMPRPPTIIDFNDPEEGEGFFLVRPLGATVGVCVSLRRGGDVEVAVGPEVVRRLVDALRAALQ